MPKPRRVTMPNWDRLPYDQRAGTRIDHANAQSVFASIGGKTQKIGHVDHRQRVLQVGGELSNFVYWKARVVSLPAEVWELAQGKVDAIEVIDHQRNRCYRLDAGVFAEHASVYDAGIGRRYGAHLNLWTVTGGPVDLERLVPAASASARTTNPESEQKGLW